MKIALRFAIAVALAAGLTSFIDAQMEMEPYKGSAEFEQLKSLIGVWEGEMPMKKHEGDGEHKDMGPMKMTVEYRLTAGGSVLQETVNGGSPMEMITMYHDVGDNLSLTHYCMLGNQPKMNLIEAGDGQLSFALAPDNALDPSGMFMNSLLLTFVDEHNMIQRWSMHQPGEGPPAQDIHFTRIQ